jgi:cyclophilin family peptidyl-prolyl cis-trans isomerase
LVKKVKCQICGKTVSKMNLKRHMLRYHPGGAGDLEGRSWVRENLTLIAILTVVAIGIVIGALLMEVRTITTAKFETTLGDFEVELDLDAAPLTAGNFIELAEGGFYDGLTFHRVAKDFVIQGGDPLGTGMGGSNKTVPWENTGLRNTRYTIAMARPGDPNSAEYAGQATSQFFINLGDNPGLDEFAYPFVVFGRVTSGFDVVNSIGALHPPGEDGDGAPTMRVEMNVSIKRRTTAGLR